MKKYEFTDETKEINGHILHRIIACRKFSNVSEGDLGGFIESRSNLSDDGKCWVYDDSCVYEYAKVLGDAGISNYAIVHGDAIIKGNVWIINQANISGYVTISGGAVISNGAIIKSPDNFLRRYFIDGDARISSSAYITKERDYFCAGPIGSRNDHVTFYKTKNGDIYVITGCFCGSIENFVFGVHITHANDQQFIDEYMLAVSLAKRILNA